MKFWDGVGHRANTKMQGCERALPQEQNSVIIVVSLDRNVLFCLITEE